MACVRGGDEWDEPLGMNAPRPHPGPPAHRHGRLGSVCALGSPKAQATSEAKDPWPWAQVQEPVGCYTHGATGRAP